MSEKAGESGASFLYWNAIPAHIGSDTKIRVRRAQRPLQHWSI